MQQSFSLNNFGVSPSASNPGDGVSEVVLSLSHQRGKKPKKKKKPKHNKVSQVQMQYSFSKSFSMQV
jgi:hypothetical protein